MNDELQIAKQRKIILVLSGLTFIFIIIAISIIFSLFPIGQKINLNKADATAGVMNNADYKKMSNELRTLLVNSMGVDKNATIQASIRNGTYQETDRGNTKELTFILDVDTAKVSYKVWMLHDSKSELDLFFNCTPSRESKFPNSFCVGTDGHSTIDTDLDMYLPYYDQNENGVRFSIKHNSTEPFLTVSLFYPCEDNEKHDELLSEVHQWISSKGFDAGIIPIKETDGTCIVYYDD